MFQWYCMLCLTLKTAAPSQSCFQSGIIECYIAMNCQLNCQPTAVKYHGQQTLLSQKCKVLKSYLKHHHLSTIPERVVTFPSSQWQDAQAGQERLPASPSLPLGISGLYLHLLTGRSMCVASTVLCHCFHWCRLPAGIHAHKTGHDFFMICIFQNQSQALIL